MTNTHVRLSIYHVDIMIMVVPDLLHMHAFQKSPTSLDITLRAQYVSLDFLFIYPETKEATEPKFKS